MGCPEMEYNLVRAPNVHKFIRFNAYSYKNMNSVLQKVTHNIKTNKNGLWW